MGCVWVVSVLLVVLLVQGVIVSGETGLHSSLLDKRDCYLGVVVSCVVDFPRHDELIITHRLKQNTQMGKPRRGGGQCAGARGGPIGGRRLQHNCPIRMQRPPASVITPPGLSPPI